MVTDMPIFLVSHDNTRAKNLSYILINKYFQSDLYIVIGISIILMALGEPLIRA